MQDAIAQINTQVESGIVGNENLSINNVDELIHEYNKLISENVESKEHNNISYEEYSNLEQAYNELYDKYTTLMEQNNLSESHISLQDIISSLRETEGINAIESYNLITYVNQYRTEAGIPELSWDPGLAKYVQNYAADYIANKTQDQSNHVIGFQSKSDHNAQEAVFYFMRGDNQLESSANDLLNAGFTQMGGALYYLPEGNEEGYCYFWFICLL